MNLQNINVDKVYLAAGYTDMRLGIDGLAALCVNTSIILIPCRTSSFFSAAESRTESKVFSGRGTAICFFTKG